MPACIPPCHNCVCLNHILHVRRAQDKLGHDVLLTELHDGLDGVPLVGVGDNEDDAHGDVDAVADDVVGSLERVEY